MADIAVIGGTGLNALARGQLVEERFVQTPCGPVSAPLQRVRVGEREAWFLARHGQPHHIPPHRINYRANVWALREVGVRRVIAVNAVGGITPEMGAGVIAVPDQIVDYTWGREHTFYDGTSDALEHVDFSYPYSEPLRAALLSAAAATGAPAVDGGVYGATQGPRLESVAEIDRMERDGCTLVGMTGMPEAALARELGLEYATLCLVVNPAAGRAPGLITMEDIRRVLVEGMVRVEAILAEAIARLA